MFSRGLRMEKSAPTFLIITQVLGITSHIS